jgi:putative transposase
LPVRRTLDKIGIPKTTFYAWLDRYAAGGLDALEDRKPRPKRVWNRIPDDCRLCSTTSPDTSSHGSSVRQWAQTMRHTRRKPYDPMPQGKIEHWHLSLKSRILLENYYLPGDLERVVADFGDHYNHRRCHESLDNLTPADVYFGRAARSLEQRRKTKRQTIEHRRRQHLNAAA